MGKKSKTSKARKASKNKDSKTKRKDESSSEQQQAPRITMQDLEEMSSGSEGSLPPEREWDEEAQALKNMIMSGKFDHLLKREDGDGEDDEDADDEIEEVELNSDSDDSDEDDDENNDAKDEVEKDAKKQSKQLPDSESDEEDSSYDEEDAEADAKKQADESGSNEEEEEEVEEENESDEEEEEEQKEEAKEEKDNEDEEKGEKYNSITQKNQVSSKALHLVTKELVAEKEGWHWGETFDIVPPTPLPFGHNAAAEADGNPLDVHDDLKREVAFYDLALEAVHMGRKKCQKAGIPFARPDDFFAEMVKSDDHMARIKDRLLFETKKMDAVAQRRSNKEQKLRSKEAHANKLAEKAKRKKDHFQMVEDWAASQQREGGSGRGSDRDFLQAMNGGGKKSGGGNNNKKRQRADKKFGFGGKRGRFKQNDPKSMNDLSGYNPAGNFAGGMKRTGGNKTGSGAARKGKRARDANRSRR